MKPDFQHENLTIVLYPSLQFALNKNEFVSFVKDAEKKMSGIDDAILESEERAEYDKTEDAEVYPLT